MAGCKGQTHEGEVQGLDEFSVEDEGVDEGGEGDVDKKDHNDDDKGTLLSRQPAA